jgi:hypothetical protein
VTQAAGCTTLAAWLKWAGRVAESDPVRSAGGLAVDSLKGSSQIQGSQNRYNILILLAQREGLEPSTPAL